MHALPWWSLRKNLSPQVAYVMLEKTSQQPAWLYCRKEGDFMLLMYPEMQSEQGARDACNSLVA